MLIPSTYPSAQRAATTASLTAILLVFLLCVSSYGQTPRLLLKFDGDLTDSSGAGIITSVTPSAGFAPAYVADRFGVANKAINFTGSQSLQLVAAGLPGNSNQALGLRNAGGTNTSFTLVAWVKIPSFLTGYNIIFGNLGSPPVATVFHAGYYINSGKTYFGFDSGTDTVSQNSTSVANAWYHLAFVYDAATGRQRVYMNGVPDVSRACANTVKSADLYIGDAGTAIDSSNDFRGALDDVAIYDSALSLRQIQALYNEASPNNPPANYIAPKLPGVIGAPGVWGVREIKGYTPAASFPYGSLVEADRVIRAYATTPAGTAAQYTSPVINFVDPQAPGNLGAFLGETNFGTNTAADDNSFLVLAKATVHIDTENDYTFGFVGDEGARLRIVGQTFLSSASVNGAATNPVLPAHQGDAIYWSGLTTNSGTVGVVHLPPGDYPIELTYWENTSASSIEVFAAPGAKSSIDNTFHLIGDTAAGGLPLARDPDTIPTFTANGGSTLFVNGGVPANFTLAWSTANPTTTLSIDHGIGAVAQSGSTILASPATTTTYTITATTPIQGGNDVATKTVTVYVDAPPAVSFTANDTTVLAGSNVTLNWVVDGATSLTLDPGNINVFGQTTRIVNPAVTTTYTLTAGNSTGSTAKSVTVTVGVPPLINSFVAADPNPLYGAETSLNWNVSNATGLSIDQNIGPVSGPTGSVSIAPLQSTTYTLTAINDFGTSTGTATVNQPTPIGVTSAGFTARRVFAKTTTPFPFASVTPASYLQSAITLLGETVGGPHYGTAEATQTNYGTVNFLDGGQDGDFPGGVGFPGNNANGSNYAVRITGTLVVNSPGRYSFVVSSSFGCRLRVDGQDIIYDDGSHAPGNSTGTIELSKPTVSLELITYGSNGNCEVELAWIRPNLQWTLLGTITPAAPAVRGQVLISEFMADNASTLADEDGIDEDWIEIWNSTNATVNLGTYFLTDDNAVPNKWQLPSWTLGANEYAVIFASAKNRTPAQAVAGKDNPGTLAQPHLHTNFKLSKTGGYLALKQANGMGGFNNISVFNPYPAQKEDVSYGSSDAEGYIGYMDVPTPGSVNAATVLDFVQDTNFSHHRGRYSAPFNLTIATATAGATIRYTKDGSIPSLSHGTVYTGPIPISATTVIRAAAFKPGWKATNVDTETYLFIDDVVTQNTLTAVALGFPIGPVNGQVFEYGMNLGNVTAAGAGQGTLTDLKNALAAAPTVCMTTEIGNLVDPATGIYVHPQEHGLFWERPVSLEYINTAGTSEFQINCGARIRGGFSRDGSNPKHAFHLFFRGSLYDGDLKYQLFGNSGATRFDQIDMRSEENYSWGFQNDGRNSLMREEWGRISQGDTGQPWARTSYFHLYINGVYWGIFNWEERTEASYGETYLGGVKENFDVVKSAGSSGVPSYSTEMTDGNFAAWQVLNTLCLALKNDATEAGRTAKYMQMRGLNPNGTPNPAFPVLLDVDNLIDYQLVTFYDGSYDAPMSIFLNNASNNWFGMRDRTGTRGFAFFIHDNEHGMDTDVQSYNRIGPWGGSGANNWGQGQYGTREAFERSNPHYLYEFLCYSAEFRQRFADRVQKQFFNDGALTTTAALNRINALAAQVDPIIHAEAARWGSATLNKTSWLNAKSTVINFINNGGNPQGGQTVFAVQPRTSMIITQLKGYQDPVGVAKPLAATLNAPTFSGQFGGPVGNPYSFTITNPNGATGALYYTVNGVDPRDIGGAVHAGLSSSPSGTSVMLTSTSTVRARIYNSTNQTWSALTEAQYSVGALATASNLVISKIHYNPPGAGNLTQFVELMNIGAENIDISGVHFDLGIQFTFPTSPLLAPGGRLLIVRDMNAFTTAYPSVPAAQIAGIFANGTSLDTGGEQLQLLDAADGTIRNFSYDNKAPWPESPDGDGPCLVLLRPTTNPDHSLGTNWRASYAAGGTPGTDDSLSYNTWAASNNILDPAADDDSDGLANVAEYGLGSNPHLTSSAALPTAGIQDVNVSNVVSSYLTLTYTRVIGHDDVSYAVEASSVLGSWVPAVIIGSPNFNGNGTETLTYRYPDPRTSNSKQFLRLRVTKLP